MVTYNPKDLKKALNEIKLMGTSREDFGTKKDKIFAMLKVIDAELANYDEAQSSDLEDILNDGMDAIEHKVGFKWLLNNLNGLLKKVENRDVRSLTPLPPKTVEKSVTVDELQSEVGEGEAPPTPWPPETDEKIITVDDLQSRVEDVQAFIRDSDIDQARENFTQLLADLSSYVEDNKDNRNLNEQVKPVFSVVLDVLEKHQIPNLDIALLEKFADSIREVSGLSRTMPYLDANINIYKKAAQDRQAIGVSMEEESPNMSDGQMLRIKTKVQTSLESSFELSTNGKRSVKGFVDDTLPRLLITSAQAPLSNDNMERLTNAIATVVEQHLFTKQARISRKVTSVVFDEVSIEDNLKYLFEGDNFKDGWQCDYANTQIGESINCLEEVRPRPAQALRCMSRAMSSLKGISDPTSEVAPCLELVTQVQSIIEDLEGTNINRLRNSEVVANIKLLQAVCNDLISNLNTQDTLEPKASLEGLQETINTCKASISKITHPVKSFFKGKLGLKAAWKEWRNPGHQASESQVASTTPIEDGWVEVDASSLDAAESIAKDRDRDSDLVENAENIEPPSASSAKSEARGSLRGG